MRREHGQAAALTVLFLAVLLLSAAAVIDVGSWFRADRDTQRIADAAALAGAHALPEDQAEAEALAIEYANKNGGGVDADDVTFPASDTIHVVVEKPAPGFFSQVAGIDSVTVGSTATARTGSPNAVRYAAPITVNEKHPMLNDCDGPCFGPDYGTSISLLNLHRPRAGDAAGAFGLLNLRRGGDGNEGAEEVASWLADGFSGWMPLGIYQSVPSANFNSTHMGEALALHVNEGDEVLFPIYREPLLGGGINTKFDIIGWVGFVISDYNNSGADGLVEGYFTQVIWEGILLEGGGAPDEFGVRTIALID